MNSYRTRVLAVGLGIPALTALIAGGLMLSWASELPDPIAIHWSGSTPDGYGPLWGNIVLVLAVTIAFSAFVVGATWRPQASGRPSGTQKFLIATSNWLAGLLAVGVGGTVWAQRGLVDASEAGDVLGWLLAGAIVGLVLAVAAWLLLPKADDSTTTGLAAEPIAASPTQRAAWSQSVRMTAGVLVLILGTVLLVVAVVAVTWFAERRGTVVALSVLVAVVLLALATTVWRVTADERGLIVRSALGWPRKHIRADDIASVQVVDVNPSADFGGWGWRWAPHGRRSGVVMRKGEAIEVTRRNGARFVVTVDDAATGAGVLVGVVARRTAA